MPNNKSLEEYVLSRIDKLEYEIESKNQELDILREANSKLSYCLVKIAEIAEIGKTSSGTDTFIRFNYVWNESDAELYALLTDCLNLKEADDNE